MKVSREGWPITAFAGFMALGSLFIVPVIAPLLFALAIGVAWFFRDPERILPEDVTDNMVISPADGKIMEVERTEHPYTGPALKIGIFMSVLDVHINRAPLDGQVDYLEYVPGKHLMAFNEKASSDNERFYVGLDTKHGPVLSIQIAGLVARRIVNRLTRGESLKMGQIFGMIKLGSKVEVLLPLSTRPCIRSGQKVKAGLTVIGVIEDEKNQKAS